MQIAVRFESIVALPYPIASGGVVMAPHEDPAVLQARLVEHRAKLQALAERNRQRAE